MELAAAVLKERPDLPVMVTTGMGTETTMSPTDPGIREYITKPFDLKTVAASLARQVACSHEKP